MKPTNKHNAKRTGEITCPECGYNGVRYVEDISCYREVYSLADGVLEIDGLYKTDGYDEDGQNPRLQCEHCCHEWPIPEDLELDFV
jgi:hypothetical protein